MSRFLLFVPLNFAAAALLAFGINWLMLIPWRRSAGAHWSERARILWPIRQTAAANIWLMPVCLAILEWAMNRQAPVWTCVLGGFGGMLGAIAGTYPLDRETFPRTTFVDWRRIVMIAWAFRLVTWSIFIACIVLMPGEVGVCGAVIAVGYLAYIFSWSLGLYVWTMQAIGILKDPGGRLWGIVSNTARRMGLRAPGTWLMDLQRAQAFALPITGELMFSRRLLEILSDDEVSAVCAHELAHLTESKTAKAGRVIGSLSAYPLIFLRPAMSYGPSAACAIYGLMLFWIFLARKLSRRMESRADKVATENQTEQGVYARALEKIYSDNLSPAVLPSQRRTHPALYDRMLAAGVQPDYPRPAKPEAMVGWVFAVWIGFGAVIGFTLAQK